MGTKRLEDQYSDEEIARRRDEALLRALSTPPKPHRDMKLGKRKAKSKIVSDGEERTIKVKALDG
jgi:hypothetical protein